MARHFSKDAVEELRQQLALTGMRDTDFEETDTFSGDDRVAIVQDGKNMLLPLRTLLSGVTPKPSGSATITVDGTTGDIILETDSSDDIGITMDSVTGDITQEIN